MNSHGSSGYWYSQDSTAPKAVVLLNLMRKYREVERVMRAKTRASMRMNETDMSALRFLLKSHREGIVPRQRDFVEELQISHASVSVMIDRLCRDGYADRILLPSDRRSVGIVPTVHSHTEVRATLDEMHQRMMEAVQTLSEDERIGAARFLEAMIHSLENEDDDTEKNESEKIPEYALNGRNMSSTTESSKEKRLKPVSASSAPSNPQDAARPAPPNKLSIVERAAILDALNSPQCVDLAPKQDYAK